MLNTGFQNESWKNFLPEVYNWLGKVEFGTSQNPVAGAHHVVAVTTADDSAGSSDHWDIDAPQLSAEFKAKLVAAGKALGWKGGSGSLHVVIDGHAVLMVVPVKTKTSEKQRARALGIDAAKALKDLNCEAIAICAPRNFNVIDIFEGATYSLYSASGFKGKKKDPKNSKADQNGNGTKLPGKIHFVGANPNTQDIECARHLCRSIAFTRMLQDAPANWLDPVRFGDIARDVAKEAGIKCTLRTKEEMVAMGMGSFVSVANGSQIEPRLITLEIDGVDNNRTVALIGKGLTFDSGGISIKPSGGMEEMKYDMSGGAAVLGSAMFLGYKKPPTKVVCIIGATENMPSGSATKPGDIVVAMNGKTIEIQNTDAEGRLVLADLLHYAASTYTPELMIDIATLTGAVLMALGTAGAGLMTNDQDAADFVMGASKAAGEPMWQLPMWPELDKETKGDYADLNNIAKPNVKAGTIMGAMFLKHFVGDRKWVHLDIAGTGWNTKATGFPGSGGSAYGLRTMVEACLRFNR
ncbi:MAG: leucyl aminopeptidase family protein [Proteobacteria bacterium]|nr:leucyl aminopeptidase family protein [Pseudomonadota bacterium]